MRNIIGMHIDISMWLQPGHTSLVQQSSSKPLKILERSTVDQVHQQIGVVREKYFRRHLCTQRAQSRSMLGLVIESVHLECRTDESNDLLDCRLEVRDEQVSVH